MTFNHFISRTLQQNQLVSNIDVITIESKAYKEIVAKIDVIANYVFSQEDTKNEDEIWVDSYEVCTFLKSVTVHCNACERQDWFPIPI